MKKWVVAAWLGAASVVALGTPGWSQNQPLLFGVIIWRSPTLTAQFWNPILRYVSERSGVPLQLKVAQTGPEHTAMVRRGEYHFLYSNHNFIKENEESGYRVFARPKEDAGTGEIVVLKDSPIRTLADLEGQEVAFPHTAAFFGYHLPMDALMRKGIQVKVHFAGNQEGAMGQLKAGRVVAAGVNAARRFSRWPMSRRARRCSPRARTSSSRRRRCDSSPRKTASSTTCGSSTEPPW